MNESLRLDEMITKAESSGLDIDDKAEQVIESVKNEKAEELSRIYDVIVAALESKHLSLTDAQEKISRLDEVSNQVIGYSISKLLGIPFSRELPYIKEKINYKVVDNIVIEGEWERLLYINDEFIYGMGNGWGHAVKRLRDGTNSSRSIKINEGTGIVEAFCLKPKDEELSIIIELPKKYLLENYDKEVSSQYVDIIQDILESIEVTRVILPGRALSYTSKGRLLEVSENGLERVVAQLPILQDLTIDVDGTVYGYRSEDAGKTTRFIYRFSPKNGYQMEEIHETPDFPDIICSGESVVLFNSSRIKIIDKATKNYRVIDVDIDEFDIIEIQPLPNGRFFALADDYENQSRDVGNKVVFINADGSFEEIGSRPDGIGMHDAYMTKDGKIFTLSSDNTIHIWDGVKK